MATGIKYSLISESFAKDILKDRVGIGAFETTGFYINSNALFQESKRKDHELRRLFSGKSEKESALKRLMSEV